VISDEYAKSVFINCPFDKDFDPFLDAIAFAIFDCGFKPRCAREEDDSGNVRIEKIHMLIAECKFGVHDISRTELDSDNKLPRFNMPLELGVFLGAKRFGDKHQKNKNCLIIDKEQYRYQKFISDISGQDIRSHDGEPEKAISVIRDWLNSASGRRTIPGGRDITRRYRSFRQDLPEICKNARLELDEMTFNDFAVFASDWLQEIGSDAK